MGGIGRKGNTGGGRLRGGLDGGGAVGEAPLHYWRNRERRLAEVGNSGEA